MIVKMPRLWDYDTYGEGTITMWYVREGDTVRKGDNLCQVLASKVTVEVPSPTTGIVKRIIKPKNSQVVPGDPIAEIEEAEGQS